MVEVFKTNVQEFNEEAKEIIQKLLDHFPDSSINFDLNDCDKILRVEAEQLDPENIIQTLKEKGFQCEQLL
jgi:hypothetical protein